MARISCGTKFLYRYLPGMPVECARFRQGCDWNFEGLPVRDGWKGDYFMNSKYEPILFRYRSVGSSDSTIRYQRVLNEEQLQAKINDDEAAMERIDKSEEHEYIKEALEEGVAKRARLDNPATISVLEFESQQ